MTRALLRAAAAVVVVLICSAAGSGDYQLSVPGVSFPERCAKSAATCEQARYAIRQGWLPEISRDAPTWCTAHIHCFDASSNTIPGFNDPDAGAWR